MADIPSLSAKEAVILQLLMDEPDGMYGLQMVRESDELKRGTVYTTLNRMAEKGLVESRREDRGGEGGLPRRVFTVTGTGVRTLKAHEMAEKAKRQVFEEGWATI